MNFLRFCALPWIAILLVIGSGCAGYRLGSVKPAALSHINSIAIPTFKNETLKQRSQVLVANEVIKQIQSDGSYEIGTLSSAEAVLRGVIKDVRRRQLRSSRTDTLRTREIEIIIEISYTLEDSKTGATLLQGLVTGRAGAYLDPNFQLTEHQTMQLAARDAAKSLAIQLGEGY